MSSLLEGKYDQVLSGMFAIFLIDFLVR